MSFANICTESNVTTHVVVNVLLQLLERNMENVEFQKQSIIIPYENFTTLSQVMGAIGKDVKHVIIKTNSSQDQYPSDYELVNFKVLPSVTSLDIENIDAVMLNLSNKFGNLRQLKLSVDCLKLPPISLIRNFFDTNDNLQLLGVQQGFFDEVVQFLPSLKSLRISLHNNENLAIILKRNKALESFVLDMHRKADPVEVQNILKLPNLKEVRLNGVCFLLIERGVEYE